MDILNKESAWVEIPENEEDDGILYAMEAPFDIKRIFWVSNVTSGATRGNHATRSTKLILIAVSGSCDIEVDNGIEKKSYHLKDSRKGVFINNMLWRSMSNFTNDCVLLALCDQPYGGVLETYDDYEEFLRIKHSGRE